MDVRSDGFEHTSLTRYCELGTVRLLKEDSTAMASAPSTVSPESGVESGGSSFSRGALYTLLKNPIYVGEIGTRDSAIRVSTRRSWTARPGT
jgi:site-specific DNA recombinase